MSASSGALESSALDRVVEPEEAATVAGEEDEPETGETASAGPKRLSRRGRRTLKEKKKRCAAVEEGDAPPAATSASDSAVHPAPTSPPLQQQHEQQQQQQPLFEIEYVAPDAAAQIHSSGDPELDQFLDVFQRFSAGRGQQGGEEAAEEGGAGEGLPSSAAASAPPASAADGSADADEEAAKASVGEHGGLSRRARKQLLQYSVAELKRSVAHPEVVEVHDVTSCDPKLLAYLKSYRNSVPVPRHWCHKRKYLQGKRGIEKPPFALPEYITATGITKMRNSDLEKADDKSLKSKTREKFAPKMGKIEIDYEVLHDAFFKFQTKPPLSRFGDQYYEGKENEQKAHAAKPGALSEKLRAALGMEGATAPPPWLIAQQRYGPPPSYPSLRIPGLSAPLPPGAAYGYHPGGWGKPPVDQFGRPLYGDVFGAPAPAAGGDGGGGGSSSGAPAGPRRLWGEPSSFLDAAGAGGARPPVEEAEGLVAPPPPADEAGAGEAGNAPPLPPPPSALHSGYMTPLDGATSVPLSISAMSGLETPDLVDLRKGGSGRGAGGPAAAQPALYTVLEERRTVLTGGLLGTTHAYVVPPAGSAGAGAVTAASAGAGAASAGAAAGGGVAVALNPDELGELDEAALARKYESELAATAKVAKEDVSDILEEQERKRKRKAEAAAGGGSKAKKSKDFKF